MTGVQTCALPISVSSCPLPVDRHLVGRARLLVKGVDRTACPVLSCPDVLYVSRRTSLPGAWPPCRPRPRCQHSLVCKCQHTNTCPSLRPVHSQLRHGMLPSVLCPGQGWPVPHSDFSGAGRSEERAPVFTALTSPGWAGGAREAQGPGRSCTSCWGNQVWRKHRGSGLR